MAITRNDSMQSISGRWAAFSSGLRFEDLPAAIVELAKERLLDCLATSIPATQLPVPTVAMALATPGGGHTTIIGHAGGYAMPDAAFVNATLINGRTQDDVLYKSHPGAVVVPAALAFAEMHHRGGHYLLAALVAGYEIVARAYVGGPGMLPRFRATGVAGAIGAAAAATRAMGLDERRTRDALGCAGVFAGGFGAGFLTGTMDVKLNVGMAARNGTCAAMLGAAGATASPLAFEGEAGFYEAMANTADDAHRAVAGLGERLLMTETVYKEYPICMFVQTPVALALALAARHRLDPAGINVVRITVSDATFTNPGFTNVAPYASALHARISARFCVAAALLGRPIDEYGYYENLRDEGVLTLADRIELGRDSQLEDEVVVDIATKDGRRLRMTGSEGETMKPSMEKTEIKFRRIAAPACHGRAEQIIDMVNQLEHIGDVNDLTALLRPPGP
ncbi:catabolic enzyme [Bordetella ansorpii]|uniref:Catabolic enzyme n=1 Tax=Bordetella ansorpii TaxID=288768 RepID=A0A157SVZ9_9BORD|nr:MmgE/PrpD family protein [Bordetella ansorpii]SAI74485.1 catabolic enzyme [Bordetella ansorpii]